MYLDTCIGDTHELTSL